MNWKIKDSRINKVILHTARNLQKLVLQDEVIMTMNDV